MADMSWEDYVEQAKKASNAKKAEAEKKLNINNENIGKLENTQVTISGESDTGKYTITGTATPEFLESLNSTKESEVVPDFKYGNGNTTIGDFTRRFYGNNATEDQMRGIAAAIFGKDFKQQEGSDISKYTFDNAKATEYGTRVGEYLANNQQGLNVGNIDSTPYVGTNIRAEFNQVSGDITKRENIYSRLNDIGKMEGYSELDSKEVEDISKILASGNVGDLTDEQVKKFQEVRQNIAGMKSEIEQIAIDNGKNADDIFSKEGKSFANMYGDNQASFKTISKRAHFLNYDVVDGAVVELDTETNAIDYLKVAEGRKEYTTAKSKYNFNGTAIDYLEKNTDATFGNSDVTKLINLKKSGVDISDEGERILQGYAYAGSYTKDANNPLVNNLNLAAQQQVAKYDNISDDNLAYLKEGGLQLEYSDGKFGISQSSVDLMTDDEKKKYQKLIDSNDVGKENLSELGGSLDRRYRENKVLESIQSNYKNKNTIQKTVEEVTEIEKVTDPGYYRYESVTSKVQGDDIGIDINSYGYSPSGKLNKRINPGNEKIVRNSEMYDSDYNIKVTSGIRNADVSEILKENPDITLEELKAQTDPVWINQNTNINPYNIENNRVAKDNINLYKGEDNFNPDFSVNAYVNGPSQTITTMQIVENVEPTIVKDKVTTSKTVDEVTDIFADAPNSFNDIREGASSNYDRITKSYATEDYKGYSLTDDEVLNKSGVTNEKLRGEILGAKNFDDLSPEAMGALYGANTELSQRYINLGKFTELNNKDIDAIEKMNKPLGKKLREISAGDKAAILGRTREEVSKYLGMDKDGLTSKLEMKANASLDINDPKVARQVLEKLSSEHPEEALADMINFTGNRKGYGDYGQADQVLKSFRAGTLEKDLRAGRLEQAYKIVSDTIDKIHAKHGDTFRKEYDNYDGRVDTLKDKFSVENMKKQAKNFEKADYDRIDAAFDKGLEATAKRMENLSGPLTRNAGNLGKVGNFFKGGKGKVALGVAGGMAAIFGVASIAGNAAEERERKRQEMNQLIAAQNANIRSGY